jgi:uncharacterized protein (TIGR02231 family)
MSRVLRSFSPALLLLLGSRAVAGPAPQIKRVVVYPDRAMVTRTVKIPCGNHVIASFPGIPPAADPQSFRAMAGTAMVDGVRWQEVIRQEAFAARAEEVQQKLDALTAEHRQSLRDESRFENARTTARGYLKLAEWFVKREMSGPKPATSVWKSALDAAIDSELKATVALGKARIRSREVRDKLKAAVAERDRIAAGAPPREVLAEAVVTCPTGGTAQVELSYLVGGASWTPSYEARAAEAARAVELNAFATVRQTTGEDWRDTQLILSTAVPRQNATPPRIRALRVNSVEQEPPRKVLIERAEAIRHSDGAAASAATSTGTRMRAVAQGLSVQLVVPEPATVAGDGTEARIRFARNRLPAEFRFRTSPKLLPFVFLVADTTNAAPFPILAGSVDLYRGGSFLARHTVETVASGARFPLSFGIEERLRAKRVVLEEREQETGLISKGRRRRYAYRFHVANYLDRTTELEVSDHIPVSEMKDVVVAMDGKTTAGYRLDPSDGIVRWRLKLAPGEQRALDLAFHIDVPSDYQ